MRKIPTHQSRAQKIASKSYERERWRQEDKAFFASKAWIASRKAFIWDNPLCEDCQGAAEQVYHDPPRKSLPEEEWLNPDYYVSLCRRCHTIRENKEKKMNDRRYDDRDLERVWKKNSVTGEWKMVDPLWAGTDNLKRIIASREESIAKTEQDLIDLADTIRSSKLFLESCRHILKDTEALIEYAKTHLPTNSDH